jgi:DNA-binding NarL/FixJ family response regulator
VRLIPESEPDLTVVAEAGDGAEAVALARTHEIDLAILDVAMPRMTGLQAAREICRRSPAARILLLSMYDNDQYFFEALKAGASGYVPKPVADRDLVEACRAAMRGEPFIYPEALTAHPHRARVGDRQADRRGPVVEGDRRAAGDQHQDR